MTKVNCWRPAAHIRAVAIGLIWREDELLVMNVLDDAGRLKGVRPPGGGVAFMETTRTALAREFEEEFGSPVLIDGPPRVIENFYHHEGAPGHEIVFAYPVRFVDAAMYEQPRFRVREATMDVEAVWIDRQRLLSREIELYPAGLLEMISERR